MYDTGNRTYSNAPGVRTHAWIRFHDAVEYLDPQFKQGDSTIMTWSRPSLQLAVSGIARARAP